MLKCLPAMRETWVQSLGQEDALEKEMASHSSSLTWKIPWMEEPGRLQSMGPQRVGHNWATSLSLFYSFGKLTTIECLFAIREGTGSSPETTEVNFCFLFIPQHFYWRICLKGIVLVTGDGDTEVSVYRKLSLVGRRRDKQHCHTTWRVPCEEIQKVQGKHSFQGGVTFGRDTGGWEGVF